MEVGMILFLQLIAIFELTLILSLIFYKKMLYYLN